jgi:superfamily I DNA/RNA helicase
LVLVDKLLGEGKQSVYDLVSFIRTLFGDTKEGQAAKVVTLSTIHKSKGREFSVVYLLDKEGTLPSKWARKDWQLQQEANLEYVAITRAKNCLVYLT